MQKFYVGYRIDTGKREVFKSASEPTEASHGHIYASCVGPFKTKRAAEFLEAYGSGNPHLTDVGTIEKIAKAESAE